MNDSFTRKNLGETLFSGYDWNTDYTRKFEKNKDQELTFAAQVSGNIQNQDYQVEEKHEMDLLNRDENVYNDGNNLEATFQMDYVQPLPGSFKLETGVKSVLRNIDSDYTYENYDESTDQYIPDLDRSNIFKYDQNVYSGYASLNFVIAKKYSVVTGMRYERTGIRGDFQGGEASFENDYDNFLPNVAISRSLPNFRNPKTLQRVSFVVVELSKLSPSELFRYELTLQDPRQTTSSGS